MHNPVVGNTPSSSSTLPTTQRAHLNGLDGIRGLAALFVALFHAYGNTGYLDTLRIEPLSLPMRLFARVLSYGPYAVPVFIVLSGFCLMLPLAQREVQKIPGGIAGFLRRRAWRILPSYYGSLLLSLGLIALVPMLQIPQNTAWDNKLPVTVGAVISHVLLIQNFNPNWLYKINGPMWSVAIEWQIYFLFPLLLLLWRRTNMALTVAVALLVGLLPHFVLPSSMSIDHSNPWFLGLFAMGMAGAMVSFSNHPTALLLRTRIPWRWLTIGLVVVVTAILLLAKGWMEVHPYVSEPLVGLAVTIYLIRYGVASKNNDRPSLSRRLLESRILVGLGAFSYSIYLIHYPFLSIINLATLNISMSADMRLLLMTLVATPFSVLCSYIFYLLVERRFMKLRERIVPPAHIRVIADAQIS